MPGQSNAQLNWKPIDAPLNAFTALYPDRNGNLWRIDLIGVWGTGAKELVEMRPIDVWATPLTQEQLAAEVDKWKNQQAKIGVGDGKTSVGDQSAALAPPDLTVTMTLLKRVQPGPYRVELEVDPTVDFGDSVGSNGTHLYELVLDPGVAWADVRYHAKFGGIDAVLNNVGPVAGSTPTDGEILAGQWQATLWFLMVKGRDMGSAYVLNGDFIISTELF